MLRLIYTIKTGSKRGIFMSAKIILNLLQKISTKKDVVHNIGMKYCKEYLDFYHQIEDYVFVKGSNVTEFKRLSEFNRLREQIKNIESSAAIIDEMFELENDISVLKSYVNKGFLVPAENVENDTDTVIKEATAFLDEAEHYIFIASNEKIILSQRFEFFRIQSIIAKCKDKEPSDEDLRKIAIELNKLKKFIDDGSAISFEMLELEISKIDSIISRIDKFDKSLYKESEYPKISLLKAVLEKEKEVEKRANALYKFVGKDIPKLLSAIKENCNSIELKPNLRLNDEKERLIKLRDKEIFEVETEYLRSKSRGFKIPFGSKSDTLTNSKRKQKVKEIKENYSKQWKYFEKNINTLIEEEKNMINTNLKLIEDIQEYLMKNISGLKLN